jgi:hypothetical protein
MSTNDARTRGAEWWPSGRAPRAGRSSSTPAGTPSPAGSGSLLYCGDHAAAKQVAAGLTADAGFLPVDVGRLEAVWEAEAPGRLLADLAYGRGPGRSATDREWVVGRAFSACCFAGKLPSPAGPSLGPPWSGQPTSPLGPFPGSSPGPISAQATATLSLPARPPVPAGRCPLGGVERPRR